MKHAPIDEAIFRRELYEQFPAMKEQIDPEIDAGLLHLEMGEFCSFTDGAIDAGDRALVIRCFQFADRLLTNGDESVKNAVAVSYIEHLEFDGESRRWAKDLMTSNLQRAWLDVREYLEQVLGEGETAKQPRQHKRKHRERSQPRRRGRGRR